MYEIHYQTDDAKNKRKKKFFSRLTFLKIQTSRRSRSTSDGSRFFDMIFNSSYGYTFGLPMIVGAERVECAG